MPTPIADLDPHSQVAAQSTAALLAAAGAHLIEVVAPAHLDGAALVAALLQQPADPAGDGHGSAALPEGAELVMARPSGARWSVQDLLEEIVAPLGTEPDVRRDLVVADAHRATPAVHDRLLKLLEEPETSTHVWLVTAPSATNTLPVAIRGRCQRTVALESRSHHDLANSLVEAGHVTDHDQATRMVTLAGGDLHLAAAAARYQLEPQLEALAAHRPGAHPSTRAADLLLAIAHLAVAAHHRSGRAPVAPVSRRGDVAVADLNRLSPEARATARRLVATCIDRWIHESAHESAGAGSTVAGRHAARRLAGLEQVRDSLTFNPPLMLALGAALSAGAPGA